MTLRGFLYQFARIEWEITHVRKSRMTAGWNRVHSPAMPLFPFPETFAAARARRRSYGPLCRRWRELLSKANYWLRFTGVSPCLEWRRQQPALTLHVGGLFGALAMQLTLAICGTDGLAICSGCGFGYIPNRRPKVNQKNYCQECREKGVPLRDASRAYRARNAKQRSRRKSP